MQNLLSLWTLAALVHLTCLGQGPANAPASSSTVDSTVFAESTMISGLPKAPRTSVASPKAAYSTETTQVTKMGKTVASRGNRFSYYLTETYWNPSALTAPAFRAGLIMANPRGNGPTVYPPEWRQGVEAFGRNDGDAFASRVSAHTAQFLTGAITRENPNYVPSASRGLFARSAHAITVTFVDRSNSGRPVPAFSSFAGAAAGGFVGNA
jgi:hypothetical protein